ncbi:hypothetical protein C0J52_11507 [Blattella germanica]|nr:hypothetical protein C0J52_11507 [Blattella germanica]
MATVSLRCLRIATQQPPGNESGDKKQTGTNTIGLSLNPEEEEKEEQKRRDASWKAMKYRKPKRDENGNIVEDEFSQMPMMQQFFSRMLKEMDYYKRMIREPSREKLLPDPLQYPYVQPPYTLVLEMTDVLVHPDWTVIVIDWNGDSVKFHPRNMLKLPRWKGSDDDRTLVDLAAFLRTIAAEKVDDVREVLDYYHQFPDPVEAFRENQRKLLEQLEAKEKQLKDNPPKGSLAKRLTQSFLQSPRM